MKLQNSYCSQKFWWLSIQPERRQLQSCCAALPQKIDLKWLKENPGDLFNIPVLQKDRADMLKGEFVPSCEDSCWRPERQGKVSRRTLWESDKHTHNDINAHPEQIHINLGSDCNLSCVYCNKEYSTAWLRDIAEHGPYLENDPQHTLNNNDRIILKLGQKKIDGTDSYNFLINEIAKYKDYKICTISGGEPLLNNSLTRLLKNFTTNPVKLYTGLGVNTNRLEHVLSDVPDNVEFVVSAEQIGMHYEFIRYNNSFERFERNLAMLQQSHKVTFSSVISNLTIFNFAEFEKYYPDIEIEYLAFCEVPNHLSASVLDETSKDILRSIKFKNKDNFIKQTLDKTYTKEQHSKLSIFLKEFARRRNLDLSIFPKSFLNWLNTPQ
jgi:organic radical activating enzyme